ncbi:helix-turn-helix domain-containing protein [Actinoplanes sp. M2I2]|uniref:AraC-like ligand-binding domain-containing protein n=1 Tax=Actinoplanes sp. M2I2 TaxID=1734444 RepID=UPI0020218E10|nr:helix-turn-helix domain-containing protein [Actinoplanes sp. M2I2]
MSSPDRGVAIHSASGWDEMFKDLHGASRIRTDAPDNRFTGRLSWHRSTGYSLAHCSDGAQQVDRQRGHIRRDPRGAFELVVPLSGSAWVQQGSAASEIQPGQMALCDVDQPYAFAHRADFTSIAFIMPEDGLVGGTGWSREPRVFDGTTGLGRLIRQAVTTVQEEKDHFSDAMFAATGERLVDLIRLASEGETSAAPPERRALVEADIRRYVRRHAGDRDLGVATIARELGWSARYVQQVLQASGTTPRDLIREERLRLARVRLSSVDWAPYSIGQIAGSCGFGSHAAFSTAFRQEFTITPREARQGVPGS